MAIIRNFDKTTKVLTMEFTTISSLVEYLQNTPINECFTGKNLSSANKGSWSGTETYEQALDFLQHGWTTKSEILTQKLKLAKKPQTTQSRRKAFQSVVGYSPIVPNYLMGIPTDMVNSKMITTKQKVITINKDISYNSGYSVNEIEDNSVKALQIVQAIETQGIRCNLNILLGIDCSYKCKNVNKIIVKVRIKNSSEKMALSKVSFPMVNASMLRRIFFRIEETIPELKKEDSRICSGYGIPESSEALKSIVEKQNQYYLTRTIDNVEKVAENLCK